MSRNYHIECQPHHDAPKTSFCLELTNKYTRSYYKSSNDATKKLYAGHGCSHVNRHVNPNFKIPKAKRTN